MTKENKIEKDFIRNLAKDLKYIYRDDIRTNSALEANFREKFQELNKVNLSDNEFSRLKEQIITADVYKASKKLRELSSLDRDDGTPLFYTLVNINEWCKNSFEVINQLTINTDDSHHRYDVILLINGVPVVQIELKTLQISPRRAIEQIVEYKNDAGNGYTNKLLSFIQLFIVSNKSNTYYFANNNNKHFSFNADERFLPIYQYADENNKKITDLPSFTETFLSKCTLAEMISRYMVLVESEQKILMMRPYQIYAVKNIVECIHSNCGNGYIWHTTGSGKTLTSFKASTLLKNNPDIEKCLFVVDRKDLDRQTREEFNKFQENCVEENTNTHKLVERLLSDNYSDKVIVTTIQKLGLALDDKNDYRELLSPLAQKRVVFIFDECHRSQFGENHKAIKEFFPKAQLFGFTGTPIFDKNSTYKQIDGTEASFKTTQDIFQRELHAYTITHAIEDQNVLRFHIDYYKADNKKVKVGETPAQKVIVESILDKHDQATANKRFNAVLATSSINHAIEFYKLFDEIQNQKKEEDNDYKSLNIACVFSPPAEGNKDVKQLQEDLPQEKHDNEENPNEKKEALIKIMDDYNQRYNTNHSINKFDLYYQDVQQRIKDQKYPNSDVPHSQKIDIVIVVDMLLTGFDSKYLNTLYVAKNLKHHGLIQAFSRTNRVLNDTKPYGNILDFYGQQSQVEDAISLFSGDKSDESKEIWLVKPAATVINELNIAVEKLNNFMTSQGLEPKAKDVANIKGDTDRAEFITHFKEVQRLKTSLEQYTDLSQEENDTIESIIPKDELRAFKGVYIDTAKRLKEQQGKSDNPNEAIDQLDFEFVLFASDVIDYDYIMGLIARYTQSKPKKQKMTKEDLISLIESDAKFMDEKEDIRAYIDTLEVGTGLNAEDIKNGYDTFKSQKSSNDIELIAKKYKLELKEFNDFVNLTVDRKIFDAEVLTDLLAPLELGWKERGKVELALMKELIPILKKMVDYQEISGLSSYEE